MDQAEVYATALEQMGENTHDVARKMKEIAEQLRAGTIPPSRGKLAFAIAERFGDHVARAADAAGELAAFAGG